MKNTYWNHNGKYQSESDKIEELVPHMGMTSNAYLNLFITASNLYYDEYNNGSCNFDNLVEDIETYVKPFNDDINVRGAINFNVTEKTLKKYLHNKSKLEKFIDKVIEFVKDKDLTCDTFTVYYKDDFVSYLPCKGYNSVTFGNKEVMDDWVRYRMNIEHCEII